MISFVFYPTGWFQFYTSVADIFLTYLPTYLLPNVSVRRSSPSSGAVEAEWGSNETVTRFKMIKMINLFILIILNLVTVSFHFYLAFAAPDEGEFCLTEILGNKIITLLSCPISLAIGFLFYSTLLILIYTKIQLHLATVCPSGPCIELPDLYF